MRKLTDFVLAHKRSVAVFWIVLTIAGMFGASRVTDQLDDQFSMPSSEAFATNQEIEERFSSGGIVEPLVAVVELPAGVSAEDPAGSLRPARARGSALRRAPRRPDRLVRLDR